MNLPHMPDPREQVPSLYLHIPFCRRACTYCNFHFSTQLDGRDAVVDAMLQEVRWTASVVPHHRVATVYAGGGTPSVLTEAQWLRLMDAVRTHFEWPESAEVTLEVNPEDATVENIRLWRTLGFNRFSLGIQSFDDRDLQAMNRLHTGAEARNAVLRAQDAGFTNLSVDLIYGLPFGSWERTWEEALALGVPHLSAYALTVEPKTALAHAVRNRSLVLPPDEAVAEQASLLRRRAREAGWAAYEVSNLAKPGWEAVHNRRYWTGAPYWGIGPGAHAFDGHRTRRANVANNAVYQRYWSGVEDRLPQNWDEPHAAERPAWEVEVLSDAERWNEWVMTSLRTAEGLVWSQIPAVLVGAAEHWKTHAEPVLRNAETQGWVRRLPNNDGFAPTDDGWLWSDQLAQDLFLV
jgi:oxygen-independent coproporphyrinogen-3 oxidase